jgi:predicted FMN-binding regulatory protein PaiB/8-oxo-dGTP pyrophosphatase MutT (NUDIX family)
LVADHPFATVVSTVSTGEEGPTISHLPLIAELEGDSIVLYGHLAKANQHANILHDREVFVIFHGPHSYVSPKWYTKNNVPTWNYAVVHMKGTATTIDGFQETVGCLKKLSNKMELPDPHGWQFWMPDDLASAAELSSAIVAFKIKVSSVEAKFKLSQNRSLDDRVGVIRGLASNILCPNDGLLTQMAAAFSDVAASQISSRRLPIQVLVILFRRQGAGIQYAVLRRASDQSWQFISGGVEVGETPMEAAKRETREECGIHLAKEFISLKTVCSVPANVFKEWKSWPEGTDVVSELAFAVEVDEPNFTLSDEHTELKWRDYDEASRLLKWDSNRTALWELSQRFRRNDQN